MNTLKQPQGEDLRVIDYIKQKLFLDKKSISAAINNVNHANGVPNEDSDIHNRADGCGESHHPTSKKNGILFYLSLFLIVIAQIYLSFKLSASPVLGVLLMILGMVGFYVSLHHTTSSKKLKETKEVFKGYPSINNSWLLLIAVFVLGFLSFMLFRNNGLGWLQILIWLGAIFAFGYSFWDSGKSFKLSKDNKPEPILKTQFIERIKADKVFYLAAGAVVFVLVLSHILFLSRMPIEMVSSQVETYIAVSEIRSGSQAILFPNNVVSEPLSYYWLAFMSLFFTESARLLAFYVAFFISFGFGLVFLYRLARLLFDKWVGLLAVLMFGISYWPVLQNYALIGSGLVFPILSAALYYLFRGLVEKRRTDFIVFGFFSGLGLLTNKLFLMMPVLALVLVLVWLLHHRTCRNLKVSLHWLGLFLFTMVLVSLPLFAAVSLNPSVYFQPILSRVSSYETALVGRPVSLFLKNFGSALGILNWSNRTSWVDGIANRPALDLVSAILFILGFVGLLFRTFKEKFWQYLSLLILLIAFLLPSAMSIAFPMENPSLTRAYGLALPTMIVLGYGLTQLFAKMINLPQKARMIIMGVVISLTIMSQLHLVNQVYPDKFTQNAWNAKQMSETILKVKKIYGQDTKAWVAGHPHWVDERAVAIMAQLPVESLRLIVDDENAWSKTTGTKLFILNVEAQETINRLKERFPNGVESLIQSQQEGKNFITFLVPEN